MTDDTLLPFDLPAVRRKKVTASFDGGLISSDGGLVLLREVEPQSIQPSDLTCRKSYIVRRVNTALLRVE